MRAHLVWLLALAACGAPRSQTACQGEQCGLETQSLCTLDADCPQGQRCTGGVCEEGEPVDPNATCTTHNDCSIGMFCNILRGVCVRCLNDDHCDIGSICRDDGTCGADAIVDCPPHAHADADLCVCDEGYSWQGDSCILESANPPDPPDPPDPPVVPDDWSCDPSLYDQGDGSNECDCGCGNFDPDCSSSEVDSCGRSHCAEGERILDGQNSSCEPIPPTGDEWTCDSSWFLDGECDCGCGADDADCPEDYTILSCSYNGCPGLDEPLADDPTACGGWTCSPNLYDEGFFTERCHCGCGVLDADDCLFTRSAWMCDVNMCPDGQVPARTNSAVCVPE